MKIEEIVSKEILTIKTLKSFWNLKNSYGKKIKDLHIKMCSIWESDFSLVVDFDNVEKFARTGGGEFVPKSQTIYLYFPSLIVYLHEFKHGLQFVLPSYTLLKNPEEDALSWSHSLFKIALPQIYRKICEEERVFYTTRNLQVFPFLFSSFCRKKKSYIEIKKNKN